MKLGFIGTGNLASAILRGVVSSGTAKAEDILIYDIFSEKTDRLSDELGVNIASDAKSVADSCEYVFCAVKPKDIAGVLDEISGTQAMIISTAAGTKLEVILSHLGEKTACARIMPNINAAVGMAMTAYCVSSAVSQEQTDVLVKLCSAFGNCMPVDEKNFSAFTAIAGSAPAFVYDFIDALAFAGVKNGITYADALEISARTVLGSAKMVLESGIHPSQLTDMVCSPGGTTVEGVATLKNAGFDAAIINAVENTVKKDKAMMK